MKVTYKYKSKYDFKVGDWITHSLWQDSYGKRCYRIFEITDTEVVLGCGRVALPHFLCSYNLQTFKKVEPDNPEYKYMNSISK